MKVNEDILEVMDMLLLVNPSIIFGRSIVLNQLCLINREIHDIDIFLYSPIIDQRSFRRLLPTYFHHDVQGNIFIGSIHPINLDLHERMLRVSISINEINICVFITNNTRRLSYSTHMLDNNKYYRLQSVNLAIEAKLSYPSHIAKHQDDLASVTNILNNI